MRTAANYASYPANMGLANALKATQSGTDDKDGKLTKAEFVNARPNNVTREVATALFAALDTENKGVLTRAQILGSLKGSYVPSSRAAGQLSDNALATLLIRMKTAQTKAK